MILSVEDTRGGEVVAGLLDGWRCGPVLHILRVAFVFGRPNGPDSPAIPTSGQPRAQQLDKRSFGPYFHAPARARWWTMENEPEGDPVAPHVVTAEAAPRPTPKRRLLGWSPLALLVAGTTAAAALGVATGGSVVPGAGMVPADFVVSSTQQTLAQHTADLVVSGRISGAGTDVSITGTGQVDFASNSLTADLSTGTSGTSVSSREVVANGNVYVGLTIDGMSMSQLTGGADWVSIPIPDQNATSTFGTGSVNPLSEIQFLERKGATVVPLGTSVIDGDVVSGYSVTPTRAEESQIVQHEISTGELPASDQQQVLNSLNQLGTLTCDVWFDSSGLLRRESVNIGGGSSGVSGQVDFTYQNYGVPVSIEAPPASDVISSSQFAADLQSLQDTTD